MEGESAIRSTAFIGLLLAFACVQGSAQMAETKLSYGNTAQFELTSPQGVRVMIDVASPGELSAPATDADILLVTHKHSDHYRAAFASAFLGQKLIAQEGEIRQGDVVVKGIASAHSTDQILSIDASNYIYIVEMGGLRIVHFGDIGQVELGQDQLEALGRVDIALTQLSNDYSGMDSRNRKGFNLMAQVKPRLIIPTHVDRATIELAVKTWKSFAVERKSLALDSAVLGGETRFLLMGANARTYKMMFGLPDL
jgi:L-ascorbate metabolism protein UlaG (beta-lactamase superfamily)